MRGTTSVWPESLKQGSVKLGYQFEIKGEEKHGENRNKYFTFKPLFPRAMVDTEAEKCRGHYCLEQMSLSGGTGLGKTYCRSLSEVS